MNPFDKETIFIKYLTLFFGIFLLFTDVVFLTLGIVYDLPAIRYLIYIKLVFNSSNIVFILKKHYLIATVIIYSVILAMMIVGVVSLGTAPAFQIYGLGMMACISYNSYLHRRVLKKQLPMYIMMALHVACYFGVYFYGRSHEPLYHIPRLAEDALIIFNSLASFCIVILYVSFYYHVAISSEEKLEKMAMMDNLTGLYNRYYLLMVLDGLEKESVEEGWLAIMDIDDFKKVNDTYGHNCGDYVLRRIAQLARETCKDCTVCRWGGEEFIILSTKKGRDTGILETLRQGIEEAVFSYEGKELKITVTIGAAGHEKAIKNEWWISLADEKLYRGKKQGKNRVVVSG